MKRTKAELEELLEEACFWLRYEMVKGAQQMRNSEICDFLSEAHPPNGGWIRGWDEIKAERTKYFTKRGEK